MALPQGPGELPHSPALMGEGLFGFSLPFVKGGLRGVFLAPGTRPGGYHARLWALGGAGVHTGSFPGAKSRVRKNTGRCVGGLPFDFAQGLRAYTRPSTIGPPCNVHSEVVVNLLFRWEERD